MPRTNLIIVSIFCLLILVIAGGYLLSITNKLGKFPMSSPVSSISKVNSPKPSSTRNQLISNINIYLVALEDNGKSGKKIGCEDSVVPVKQNVEPSAAPLKAAIEKLLSLKEQNFGQSGLYNSLYQSNLKLDQVVIDATGSAVIKLSGTIALGGVCDNPRFKSQLEETALQFPTVKTLMIYINDNTLDEALSLK